MGSVLQPPAGAVGPLTGVLAATPVRIQGASACDEDGHETEPKDGVYHGRCRGSGSESGEEDAGKADDVH